MCSHCLGSTSIYALPTFLCPTKGTTFWGMHLISCAHRRSVLEPAVYFRLSSHTSLAVVSENHVVLLGEEQDDVPWPCQQRADNLRGTTDVTKSEPPPREKGTPQSCCTDAQMAEHIAAVASQTAAWSRCWRRPYPTLLMRKPAIYKSSGGTSLCRDYTVTKSSC